MIKFSMGLSDAKKSMSRRRPNKRSKGGLTNNSMSHSNRVSDQNVYASSAKSITQDTEEARNKGDYITTNGMTIAENELNQRQAAPGRLEDYSDSTLSVNPKLCCCESCKERRYIEEEERSSEFKQNWYKVSQLFQYVFQGEGYISHVAANNNIPIEIAQQRCFGLDISKATELIKRLCELDSHQLFRYLEVEATHYLKERRHFIFEQKPADGQKLTWKLAKLYSSSLLSEYASLCNACKRISSFCQSLEISHLKEFNLTLELHQKHLFHDVIYREFQNILPDIVIQLRKHMSTDGEQDDYVKLMKLEDEMNRVCIDWRECHQLIEQYRDQQDVVRTKKSMMQDDWRKFRECRQRQNATNENGTESNGEHEAGLKRRQVGGKREAPAEEIELIQEQGQDLEQQYYFCSNIGQGGCLCSLCSSYLYSQINGQPIDNQTTNNMMDYAISTSPSASSSASGYNSATLTDRLDLDDESRSHACKVNDEEEVDIRVSEETKGEEDQLETVKCSSEEVCYSQPIQPDITLKQFEKDSSTQIDMSFDDNEDDDEYEDEEEEGEGEGGDSSYESDQLYIDNQRKGYFDVNQVALNGGLSIVSGQSATGCPCYACTVQSDNFQASKSFNQWQHQKQLLQLQQHLQQQQQSLLSFPNSVIHFSPNVDTQSHLAQFSQSFPPACAQQQTCCSSHQHLMPDLEGATTQSDINSAACIDLLGKTEENTVVDANATGQNDAVATFLPHLQLDISKLTSIAMSGIPASFSGIDSSWFVSARNGESCTLHLNGTTQPSLPFSGSPATGNPGDATHLFTSAGLVNSSLSVNDRQSQESRASDSPYNALGHNFMFLSQKNPLLHAGLSNDGAAENANSSDPSSVISWLKYSEQDQQHTNFAPHNFSNFKFNPQPSSACVPYNCVNDVSGPTFNSISSQNSDVTKSKLIATDVLRQAYKKMVCSENRSQPNQNVLSLANSHPATCQTNNSSPHQDFLSCQVQDSKLHQQASATHQDPINPNPIDSAACHQHQFIISNQLASAPQEHQRSNAHQLSPCSPHSHASHQNCCNDSDQHENDSYDSNEEEDDDKDEDDEEDDSGTEENSTTSASNSQKDGKFCECWHCEFFGHSQSQSVPTSKNYTEMRDKLRLRLKKKNEEKLTVDPKAVEPLTARTRDCSSNVAVKTTQQAASAVGLTKENDIEELLKFINGEDEIQKLQSAKAAKRARQKQRKIEEKLKQENENNQKNSGLNRAQEERRTNGERRDNQLRENHNCRDSNILKSNVGGKDFSWSCANVRQMNKSNKDGSSSKMIPGGKENEFNNATKVHTIAAVAREKHSEASSAGCEKREIEGKQTKKVTNSKVNCANESAYSAGNNSNSALTGPARGQAPSKNGSSSQASEDCSKSKKSRRSKKNEVKCDERGQLASPAPASSDDDVNLDDLPVYLSTPVLQAELDKNKNLKKLLKQHMEQGHAKAGKMGVVNADKSGDTYDGRAGAVNDGKTSDLNAGRAFDSNAGRKSNHPEAGEKRTSVPSQPLSQLTKKNSFGSDQQMKQDVVTSVAGRKVQRSGPDDGKKNLDSSQTRLPSSTSMQSNMEPVSNSKQSCKEPAEVMISESIPAVACNTAKQKKSKRKGKPKTGLTSVDEIFMPKDPDNNILDDSEREVEEFKRFCLHSTTSVKRERLQINMNVKDIFLKKKQT